MNAKKQDSPQYLTQIKELPEIPEKENVVKIKTAKTKPVTPKTASQTKADSLPDRQTLPKKDFVSQVSEKDEEGKKAGFFLPTRDIILGVINILMMVILIVILIKLPTKAREIKDLRKE